MNGRADRLKSRIMAARRQIPADLVLRRGQVINLFTGAAVPADVAVHDGIVVGIGQGYEGRDVVDLDGMWVAPSLIDGHIHIESSMLLPSRLAEAVLPHGTTAIVADPHEIANVLGLEGIRILLDESRDLPFDTFFMAPSCVPATHLETSGARLGAGELEILLEEPRMLGLAEMMNVPGVLFGDPEVLAKIELFRSRILDGHCPGLTGEDLQGYLTAGIRSDHECTTAEEAREKAAAGMFVMIREGTSARNLDALLPAVTQGTADRFCFVSDDLHPQDILRRGHLDHMIRRAVRAGMPAVTAIRLASLNPSCYFGLRDRGAVAPGYLADLVVLEDLDTFSVNRVFKKGQLVAEKGRSLEWSGDGGATWPTGPLATGPVRSERFSIPDGAGAARIIEIVPGQILTREVRERPAVREGQVVSDPERDILKIAVLERHRETGGLGLGLVRGFGLRQGALASSVAHDSHNLIAVGVGDDDLCLAAETVRDMGGGLAAVRRGEVIARVALPIAGLLSDKAIHEVARGLDDLNLAAADLGCRVEEPFMALSFLALPVIPALKLTDRGLVDVARFEHVPLFPEDV